MRNFGLADAAELFVLLAGFSSMTAYGRCFERDGVGPGLRRVVRRCLRLYLFQVGLLLSALLIVRLWARQFGLEPWVDGPLLHGTAIRHGLVLAALPANLDILPLYIVLLAAFPLLYALLRFNLFLGLAISAALWLTANCVPGLNLPNTTTGTGWFFNPLAWQFLFALGAALAMVIRRGGAVPRRTWLIALAWGYIGFSLFAAAPWRSWGWPNVQLIPIAAPDKTLLSPLRLLDALAVVYVALAADAFRRFAERGRLALVQACGRHSLEIFSIGTILSLLGRLLFDTVGTGAAPQLLVNAGGLFLLLAAGRILDRPPVPPRRRPPLRENGHFGAPALGLSSLPVGYRQRGEGDGAGRG